MSNYAFYRVFCSTTIAEDDEREAFYRVLAEVNEAVAMPSGNLMVAVSLVPRMVNKQVYQHAVNENVRDASFYLQVVADTWGPRERNLLVDYELACRCVEEGTLPMRHVALAVKSVAKRDPEVEQVLGSFTAGERLTSFAYSDLAEFELQVKCLLVEWAQQLPVRNAVMSA